MLCCVLWAVLGPFQDCCFCWFKVSILSISPNTVLYNSPDCFSLAVIFSIYLFVLAFFSSLYKFLLFLLAVREVAWCEVECVILVHCEGGLHFVFLYFVFGKRIFLCCDWRCIWNNFDQTFFLEYIKIILLMSLLTSPQTTREQQRFFNLMEK